MNRENVTEFLIEFMGVREAPEIKQAIEMNVAKATSDPMVLFRAIFESISKDEMATAAVMSGFFLSLCMDKISEDKKEFNDLMGAFKLAREIMNSAVPTAGAMH